jgi:DNA-binding MarR family transcriptional regulator
VRASHPRGDGTAPDDWHPMKQDSGAHARSFDEAVRQRVREFLPDADLTAVTMVFNLMRAANRIGQDFERNVHRLDGSSRAGFRVLFSLWVTGPSNQRALARLSNVTAASMSGVLHRLEQEGLVRRRRGVDARSLRVELTPAGLEQVTTEYALHYERERAWAEALSPAELEQLNDFLRRLVLHQPPASSSAGAAPAAPATGLHGKPGDSSAPARTPKTRGPSGRGADPTGHGRTTGTRSGSDRAAATTLRRPPRVRDA